MKHVTLDTGYKDWLNEIKSKIKSEQMKALLAANSALIRFYWDLGKMIYEKQNQTNWGDKIIEHLSLDLKKEFPEMSGFSSSNLKYCKRFYVFYLELEAIGQQLVDQLPWGHNILIFTKSANFQEADFYLRQTIENQWSRDVLALQIKSKLYFRQGKAISNFKKTLQEPFSELAQQTLKDPYVFDFLTLAKPFKEKDIEQQLLQHLTNFLLELGKGFAFIGKQYHLEIGETDYYIDLLFYHIQLKCFVVVELKNTKFIPEYAGKLNFYLSAVDSTIKGDDDKPTIGILLCRDKNNVEAEFALRDMSKPMGISEFHFTEAIPENLKSSLPTIEELENELKNIRQNPA